MFYMLCSFLFFFNDTATTEIYTLSLHDALPICTAHRGHGAGGAGEGRPEQRPRLAEDARAAADRRGGTGERSEEHTSELQSRQYLVCRLLLEKKKQQNIEQPHTYYKHANLSNSD